MYLKTLIGMVAVSAVAFAAQAEQLSNEQMMSELKALRAEVSQLRAAQGDDWMNERRAEEVKTLIRDVLSDADTRASLMDSSLTAGHNGDHFFLASDDGNFLLEIIGQVQFRFVYNHANDDRAQNTGAGGANAGNGNIASDLEGFSVRRGKIGFQGNLFSPEFTYRLSGNFATNVPQAQNLVVPAPGIANERDNAQLELEDAWIAWNFHEGWTVRAGQFKGPFMRDELVDSKHQMAAERSIITDILGVDRTQGVELSWQGDPGIDYPVRVAAMIHDGSYGANRDEVTYGSAFQNAGIVALNNTSFADPYDFGVGARAEILLAGTWEQFNDYSSWSGEELGILVGAAINYDNSAGGTGPGGGGAGTLPDTLKYTLDVSIEVPEINGLSVTLAYVHSEAIADTDDPGAFGTPVGSQEIDPWGIMAQAGIFVLPDEWELFVRYEYFNADLQDVAFAAAPNGTTNLDEFDLSILTVGTNYYMQRHALKLTVDVVYAFDSTANALGLTTASGATAAGAVGVLPVNAINNGMVLSGDADDNDGQVALRAQVQFLF
jgi:hypothetical protein